MTVRIGTRLAAMTMVGILLGVMLCGPAYSQTPALRAERDLFAAVNQARRAQGLTPLRWDGSLATAARRHARVMAERRSAQHGFEGEPSLSARVKQAGAHFSWLSENVIQGPSTEFIHVQFMKSPPHRANILDRDMDSIGIGVVEQRGQLFAVEDLSQAR
ncbi:MAG TPA: CAP domain-containing protein [Terriglobales bacterium]|nr:CAP domain-containing protein [Terriglobales bacterium]